MRDRFEELMTDPCCTSCDCDAASFDVAAYLDRKTCDAERCRMSDDQPPTQEKPLRVSTRVLNENGPRR